MIHLFESEREYGNVEYKLHLNKIKGFKIHHHISQIKYRIMEGNGLAYYVIGIHDNGEVIGLNKKELQDSLFNIKKLVCALYYKIPIILYCSYQNRKFLIVKIVADIDIYRDLNYFIT